jgi:hypothetical protein
MNTVSLLAIFAENRSGQLARVTRVLSLAGVNIRWVTIASSDAFGVVKLLVDRTDLAYQRLKQDGLPVSRLEVLALDVEDKPGGLMRVAECLARNQINMENASGFVASGRAVLLIETKEITRAAEILESQSMRLLSQEEAIRI